MAAGRGLSRHLADYLESLQFYHGFGSGLRVADIHIYNISGDHCRAASPLVRLVEGKEKQEALDHPQGVLPLNWGETELNHSVTCMVLKATANDRIHLALSHEEFRGPLSGFCRSGGISNNNTTTVTK
ncbi:uncharacterized protein TNCV_2326871 [Trichonephila clavipes]|nr:uncharacterized protein TNCV_2326871 [Trichonephila clavipes]